MLIVAIRTVIMYVSIIFSMRLMGKRQLGELQPSELVTTILISNLASLPIEETNIALITGLIPIAIIVALEIITSAFELKSPVISKLISGSSKIIIRDGKIDQKVMGQLRYSVTDVLSALRSKDIFDVAEVDLGIIETNGKLNIYRRENDKGKLMIPVITDGRVNVGGLKYIGKNEEWVSSVLKQKKITAPEVLLLQCDRSGDFELIKRIK